MGGVVASEALNLLNATGHSINTAILSQAALSAHFYNGSVPTRAFPEPPIQVGTTVPINGVDYFDCNGFAFVGPNSVGGESPRFANIGGAAHNLVNFFNEEDAALQAWNVNAVAGRPAEWEELSGDPAPGFGDTKYEFDREIGAIYRVDAAGGRTQLHIANDAYEMYAHALASASEAIGRHGGVAKRETPQVSCTPTLHR